MAADGIQNAQDVVRCFGVIVPTQKPEAPVPLGVYQRPDFIVEPAGDQPAVHVWKDGSKHGFRKIQTGDPSVTGNQNRIRTAEVFGGMLTELSDA